MKGERALEAVSWAGLGAFVGIGLSRWEVWPALFFAALLAAVAAVRIVANSSELVDAVTHGGRKKKRCRVIIQSNLDESVCNADTREDGVYGRYCAEHFALLQEAEKQRLNSDHPIRWGTYTIARDGRLRWGDYTLYRAAQEGELVPL